MLAVAAMQTVLRSCKPASPCVERHAVHFTRFVSLLVQLVRAAMTADHSTVCHLVLQL